MWAPTVWDISDALPGQCPGDARRAGRHHVDLLRHGLGVRGVGDAAARDQGLARLSSGELGLAALGLEAGAVIGLPLGGALTVRAGSRRALQVGFAIYPPALLATALAGGLGALAPTL